MRVLLLTMCLWVGVAAAQIPTARQDVLTAMNARPSDPWPRGQGHVVLAIPGSLERTKSYHEPGGSFSPEFGSFGVSLWITNLQGGLIDTSDSIALAQIHQSFAWHDNTVAPSIRTETGEYRAEWSVGPAIGASQLLLNPKPASNHKLMLAIRSVGPAGAAIESLQWNGKELWVNGRYRVEAEPLPASVYVGPEGTAGWTTAQSSSATECHGQKGWCYARLELTAGANPRVRIIDSFPPLPPNLPAHGTRSALEIGLPDTRFGDSLDAQVAHLMMGLVDDQTRPGDPNQYPLTWLRDGAYEVVALARAGHLDTARELTKYFAEKDFFGGFGAEGDNPGHALWAMEEVASRVRDPSYDRYLWPHVHRKAEFILGMQATRAPIERVFAGILVPEHRAEPDVYELAQPAQHGLIEGRMDLHHPALYITAVSYNGLKSAAEIADRLHYDEEAHRWRATAEKLKAAWNAAYRPDDPKPNERTFISGVWPTWIAADRAAYETGLEERWRANWDPEKGASHEYLLWTYFAFATAHQYVLLGQPERPWQALEWFWSHQPSPGLYSWWEGNGEENTFQEWDYVRGWVHPPHVTPHYWSAAECLLMQLDMLAYVDGSASQPTVVIGGGLPSAWSHGPMHVHGLPTKWGRLDWDWDGKAMVVRAPVEQLIVRLGAGLPPRAKVSVLTNASEHRPN